ncbi:MAG: hypothetical protein J6I98_04140, partial [Clostridia bacterium]|nr:hypothetical protein [Clostridia bacterium]
RTEIMSGDGPDLYIVNCRKGLNNREPLFPVPEKAMTGGLFLSLDDYIDNAQFMEWDKHTKAIMDAGRDEYGQQIVPMAYTLPLTFYRTADVPDVKPDADTSWQDMLADESGVLKAATAWRHDEIAESRFADYSDNYLEYILGNLANFENDELLVTQEELLERVTEVIEIDKACDSGEASETPPHYQTCMYVGFDYGPRLDGQPYTSIEPRSWLPESYRGIHFNDPQTMIPIYSDDGGVTATVTGFMAIDANTDRAEDAFFLLDFIMSREWQRKNVLYAHYEKEAGGIPVHEDLMQRTCPIFARSQFYLLDENYAEYSRVREQINRVYFQGTFTDIFDDMYWECRSAYDRGEDLMPIVEEYYTQLKILMAE